MSTFDATSDPNPTKRSGQMPDQAAGRSKTPNAAPAGGLPKRDGAFLGIQFDCCGIYGRIYRDRAFRFYTGRCPKCMKRIEVPIGDGGSGQRFFRAQ